MTEDEAKGWMADSFGVASLAKVERFVAAVCEENDRQNLIAPSTVGSIWSRHVVDSAQLVPLASKSGMWLDIGTGAGFPGLVVAFVRDAPMMLVEPRRQRAAFLRDFCDFAGLSHVTVAECKVEHVEASADVISARAVAPVEKLLQAAAHCGTTRTRWLLPRGASGMREVAAVQQRWRGVFHMKQSLTDAGSTILICDGPSPR